MANDIDLKFYDISQNLVGLRYMGKKFFFVLYFADFSTFLGRTYFYPKKWFYFVHVTGAVFIC